MPAKLSVARSQAQKGLTVNVQYRRKRDKKVIVRNVGVVEIKGGKVWIQDQDDGGKVKSLLVDNLISISPSDQTFNDGGHNRYKKRNK
jgi:hypothetical protein